MASKPNSITARVAYADYFTKYAWHARGSGFADTVTPEGLRLFAERLTSARQILDDAKSLPDKDPFFYYIELRVALGQSWPKLEFDKLAADATTFEPTFWPYDTERAYSLQPRWYGEPGDWEAYAYQASQRAGGLGAEDYARIVMYFANEHDNIFRETNAIWPKTREGLLKMQQEYPRSLLILNYTALLASMAQDRPLAKQTFDHLGDNYVQSVWNSPAQFESFRNWAEGGG
jgi:hypothetical protein